MGYNYSWAGGEMAKAITDEQRDQWSSVHRQALALAEFFDRKAVQVSSVVSRPAMASAIRVAAEPSQPFARRFAGLREALSDLLEMSSYLPTADLRELESHVRAQLGIGLDELQSKRLARIASIVTKGRISTDEQFRLLKGRHDQIWDDPSRSEERAALTRLLDEYEKRKPVG